MPESTFVRRATLAGVLVLSLAGVAAPTGGAEAMPVSPALAGAASADGTAAGPLTAVQYMRYPRYRYRRFNRHRRVGLYRCGPGGLNTHLERKACRG